MNKIIPLGMVAVGGYLVYQYVNSQARENGDAGTASSPGGSPAVPSSDSVRAKVWAAIRSADGPTAPFPSALKYEGWSYYFNLATGQWPAVGFDGAGIGDREMKIPYERWFTTALGGGSLSSLGSLRGFYAR